MQARAFAVGRTGRSTPLLIPSFSSKDSWAARRMQALGHLLLERLLVSALDLSRGYVPMDAVVGKTVVFVDSGGYEADLHRQWSKALRRETVPWTRDEHEALIARLPVGPHYVLTTFDEPPHKSPSDQLRDAQGFRDRFAQHDVEFLLKPPAGARFVAADHVAAVAAGLTGFASLGVTEEDLGSSIRDRVKAVAAIRKALQGAGASIPVHVYGCINPVVVYLYCAAGADIFDGLGWFQHAFDSGRTMHIDDWSVCYGDWKTPEGEVLPDVDHMNLIILDRMEKSLQASKSVPNQEHLRDIGLGKLPFANVSNILRDCGVT